MTLIVRLIAKYALWIYILCGVGMLLYLRAALSARNEGSQAIFSLERETAAKRMYSSSGMILVLLLIVVGVYALSNYVELPPVNANAATVPDAAGTATAQAEGTGTVTTRTPTPTAANSEPPQTGKETLTPEPTSTRRPRITTIALPTLEQSTPAPEVLPAVCPHANVQVTQPGQNQVLDAGIEVRGTALKEAFDRYEFKFRSRDLPNDEWHWVETFRDPVSNGSLGVWSTAHLPPGRYQFLLIVIDKMGNSQECIVPVSIQR
jgi:hypothetical protein